MSEESVQHRSSRRTGYRDWLPGRGILRRRWIIVTGLAFIGLAVLAVFLPLILSTSGGRFWFAGRIGSRFDAPVNIESLSLSWTSPQRIEGFSVEGAHSGSTGDVVKLLDVRNATVQTTLFDLLFTDEPLVLEIDGARVSLRRHGSGLFNVDGLFGDEEQEGGDVGQLGAGAGPGVQSIRQAVQNHDAAGWLPDFGREVIVRLQRAYVSYDDRVLSSRVAMKSFDGELRMGPDGSSLRFSAEVEPVAGESTSAGRVKARVTASGWETTLADLEVAGTLELASIDLQSITPILREYAKFAPPEDPVHAKLRVYGADGLLTVRLDVDAGVIGVSGAVCEVPLESHDRMAEVTIPGVVDLLPAVALIAEGLDMSREGRLEGRVDATLHARAPLTVVDLRDRGWAALEGLSFDVDASSDRLLLDLPLGAEHPALVSGLGDDEATGYRASIAGELTGFTGSYMLPPSFIRVDGEMELAGDFRCGELTAEHVATRFSVTGGRLRLEDARVTVNGGELTSSDALLDLESVPPVYELELGLDGVGASQETSLLLAYVLPFLGLEDSCGQLAGVIDGELRLAGRGFGVADVEESLEGRGSVRLSKGFVRGSRILRRVSELFGSFVDRVPFDELRARFDLGDGRVRARDVFVRTTETAEVRDLGLEGTTFFDRRLDHSVRLVALQEAVGVYRAPSSPGDLDPGARAFGGGHFMDSWSLRFTGTIVDPVISVDPVPGLSVPVDDALDLLFWR